MRQGGEDPALFSTVTIRTVSACQIFHNFIFISFAITKLAGFKLIYSTSLILWLNPLFLGAVGQQGDCSSCMSDSTAEGKSNSFKEVGFRRNHKSSCSLISSSKTWGKFWAVLFLSRPTRSLGVLKASVTTAFSGTVQSLLLSPLPKQETKKAM